MQWTYTWQDFKTCQVLLCLKDLFITPWLIVQYKNVKDAND